MSRFINKTDAKRLIKKLQMKYGIELEEMNGRIESDIRLHGFITMETEIAREDLMNKIKEEEKHYQ